MPPNSGMPDLNPWDNAIPESLRGISAFQKTFANLIHPFEEINALFSKPILSPSIADKIPSIQQTFETINMALQPSEEFSHSVNAIQDTLGSLGNGINKIAESYIHFGERLNKIQRPVLDFQASWIKLLEGKERALQNQAQEFLDIQFKIQKEFSSILEPAIQLSGTFQRSLEPLSQLEFSHNRFISLFKQIDGIISEIEKGAKLTPEGTIETEVQTLSVEETNRRLRDFFENGEFISELRGGQRSLQEQLKWILDYLNKLDSPLRVIIFQILLPFLVAICSSTFINNFPETDKTVSHTRKQIIEGLKRDANSFALDNQVFRKLRFVNATVLFVREKPKRQSRPIGKIYNGWVVRVVKFKRHWTLIEYLDGEIAIQGWVFRRYLGKLGRQQ